MNFETQPTLNNKEEELKPQTEQIVADINRAGLTNLNKIKLDKEIKNLESELKQYKEYIDSLDQDNPEAMGLRSDMENELFKKVAMMRVAIGKRAELENSSESKDGIIEKPSEQTIEGKIAALKEAIKTEQSKGITYSEELFNMTGELKKLEEQSKGAEDLEMAA